MMRTFSGEELTGAEFRKRYAAWKKHLFNIIVVTCLVQTVCLSIFFLKPEFIDFALFMMLGLTLSTNLLAVGYVIYGFKNLEEKAAGFGF